MFDTVEWAKFSGSPAIFQPLNSSRALLVSSAGSLDANTHMLMNYKLTGNYEDLQKVRAILVSLPSSCWVLQFKGSCLLRVWWAASIFSIKLLRSSGMALKHNIPSVLCFPPKGRAFPFMFYVLEEQPRLMASHKVCEQQLSVQLTFLNTEKKGHTLATMSGSKMYVAIRH